MAGSRRSYTVGHPQAFPIIPRWPAYRMSLTALRVRGPFRGPTGYERHTRAFVRALHRLSVAIELVDLPEWSSARLPPGALEPWFEHLDRPVGARVSLQFCMPHQVVPSPGMAVANYTMFEADRIPPAWVAHHHECDRVVLPTESSREAWIRSGVPAEKLRLCPLGVDVEAFGRPAEPLPLVREDGRPVAMSAVRFLNVSELGPRKNLDGLLRAWLRATTDRDPAVLVLKVGVYAPGWRAVFERRLAEVQRELGKPLAAAAPLHLVFDVLADPDMPRLYAAATHFISLSHGEGWDQCMLEAAASGLRLIAPDHSAYRAYLDAAVAQMIPSRLVPATFPGGGAVGSLFDGAQWWQPDEDAAVEAIRRALEGRDADLDSPRPRILRDLSWDEAARRLAELLANLEAQGRPAPRWPLPRASTAV